MVISITSFSPTITYNITKNDVTFSVSLYLVSGTDSSKHGELYAIRHRFYAKGTYTVDTQQFVNTYGLFLRHTGINVSFYNTYSNYFDYMITGDSASVSPTALMLICDNTSYAVPSVSAGNISFNIKLYKVI